MQKYKTKRALFNLTLILLCLPFCVFSKPFLAAPAPSNYTEQCLAEIIAHPLGEKISSRDFDEYFDLCNCIRKKNPSLDEKDRKLNGEDFIGPEKHLANLDQCAMKTLSKNNLEKFFVIQITTKFESLLYEKIKGHFAAGISMVANETSMAGTTECIQKSILYNCTKVHAFTLAYQCIKDVFHESDSSHGAYRKILGICPNLSTEEPPLFDKNHPVLL